MGQTYTAEITATQGLTPAALDMTNNYESLRSSFSGATPPTTPAPVNGQFWKCTNTSGGYVSGVEYLYSGSAWQAVSVVGSGAPGSVALLATVTGIDGKTVATTNLLATVTARTVVDWIELEVTAIDAISANPDMGAGVAAGEDDVCGVQSFSAFTAVSAVGQVFRLEANPISRVVAIGETLKLGIDTGAVGTTLTLTARVFGHTT